MVIELKRARWNSYGSGFCSSALVGNVGKPSLNEHADLEGMRRDLLNQ